MRILHVGVDDVLELLQGFPHDVDILDVQKDELCVLVLIAFVASAGGLWKKADVKIYQKAKKNQKDSELSNQPLKDNFSHFQTRTYFPMFLSPKVN